MINTRSAAWLVAGAAGCAKQFIASKSKMAAPDSQRPEF
jgi:hypothetical protein